MKMRFASAAVASLIALFVAGCGSTPAPKAEAAPAVAAKPALSAEATQALAKAEADAAAAKKAFALWIPTESALKDAQAAAKEGDSATVIKLSKKVSDLSKLGIAQNDYPSTEMK
jgi:murein lipoprotein